jgi:hypothetical protein
LSALFEAVSFHLAFVDVDALQVGGVVVFNLAVDQVLKSIVTVDMSVTVEVVPSLNVRITLSPLKDILVIWEREKEPSKVGERWH